MSATTAPFALFYSFSRPQPFCSEPLLTATAPFFPKTTFVENNRRQRCHFLAHLPVENAAGNVGIFLEHLPVESADLCNDTLSIKTAPLGFSRSGRISFILFLPLRYFSRPYMLITRIRIDYTIYYTFEYLYINPCKILSIFYKIIIIPHKISLYT